MTSVSPTSAERPPQSRFRANVRTASWQTVVLILGSLWSLSNPKSLVVGLACLVAAVVLAGLLTALSRDRRTRRRDVTDIIAITFPFLLISLFVFLVGRTALRRAADSHGIVRCASNIRQMGHAARAYAILHGVLPPDIEALYSESFGETDLPVFVCPEDRSATPAPPPFVLGKNLSYVYLGGGRKEEELSYERPLGYCLPANHNNEGTHVLFGDGSVRWVDAKELKSIGVQVGAP